VPDWFYDEVVRHHQDAEPSRFRQVRVVMKETEMTGWVRVLGGQETPVEEEAGRPAPPEPTQPGELSNFSLMMRHSLPPDTAAVTRSTRYRNSG
jgi:hypothetical protein